MGTANKIDKGLRLDKHFGRIVVPSSTYDKLIRWEVSAS
jgi:hypothetical protein